MLSVAEVEGDLGGEVGCNKGRVERKKPLMGEHQGREYLCKVVRPCGGWVT